MPNGAVRLEERTVRINKEVRERKIGKMKRTGEDERRRSNHLEK